jgi:hypothetical protein
MFKKICASVLTLVFVSVVLSGEAFAQCADGANLYDGVCYGVHGATPYGSVTGDGLPPQGSSGSTNSGRSQPTRTVIVDRFGAVAFNAQTGRYGYSSNAATQSEANSAAINDCDMAGCKIFGSYHNACAALVSGEVSKGMSSTVFRWNLNLDIAKKQALKECNKRANNCQVLVAECSIYGQ